MSSTVFWLVCLLAFGWLGGGCAMSSGGSSAPKRGRGIAEYRKVVREADGSVAAVVDSLTALSRSSTPPSTTPALRGFDRALGQLELASVHARARAEAILARGQAYFDEWKGNLAGITNEAVARVETNRYSRLSYRFGQVRQRSGEVRAEFHLFMATLREFRARLDHPPRAGADESFGQELNEIKAAGQRVRQTLAAVSSALNDAEAELRATLPDGHEK